MRVQANKEAAAKLKATQKEERTKRQRKLAVAFRYNIAEVMRQKSAIHSGWNTVVNAPPVECDPLPPPGFNAAPPAGSTSTAKEPHVKGNGKGWFDRFIRSTKTEKYRNVLIDEECNDQRTLKLFSEEDFAAMGIKKGARLRMLNYLTYGKNMEKGRPAPRLAI